MSESLTQFQEQASKEILQRLLECNSACADVNSFSFDRPTDDLGKIDFFMKVLPGAEYINSQLVNYVFSNGLTTGYVDQDATLETWLYQNNGQETTNYSVLRDAISLASSYGEAGIRWYEGDIYLLRPGTYAPLTTRIDGIEKVVAYVARKDGGLVEDKQIKLDELTFDENEKIFTAIERYFTDNDLMLMDKDDFVNLRNRTTSLHGESPLLKDELRLELLVTAYERLIHDLNYEGPGRILFWTKDGYVSDEANELSTSNVMNQSAQAKRERETRAKKALEDFATEFKNSKTDSIGVVPGVFGDNFAHFPKVTKATEFFDWMENEGVILAQVYGMSPSLLELGRLSGNVSMEKIIDDSMLNKIVPLRENYAIQFSPMIASKIGVGKVYFNKYELAQAEDENTMRTKIVNIMSILNSVGSSEDERVKKQAHELTLAFGEMLTENIHHENGELKKLKAGKKEDGHGNDNERGVRESGEHPSDYGEEWGASRFL